MMQEVNIDVITGEKSVRDFTSEELALVKETAEIEKEVNKALIQKAAAKAALFEKLGITEDEAKLLLS